MHLADLPSALTALQKPPLCTCASQRASCYGRHCYVHRSALMHALMWPPSLVAQSVQAPCRCRPGAPQQGATATLFPELG